MTAIDLAPLSTVDASHPPLYSHPIYPLIDTHTHFDAPIFDDDRQLQAQDAYVHGVRHLILVGYLYRHFERLYSTQQSLQHTSGQSSSPTISPVITPDTHIALGLHPFYIEQHTDYHLAQLKILLQTRRPIAIGEIGLDSFTKSMKQPEVFAKQQRFFVAQLDMAVEHQLPVMLHIRKSHAEALAILKSHSYNAHELGGIAHSFSGGVQEAKAFVKLGFKLGVTGQVSNPNAKKLRRAIEAAVADYGIECLVIETDCPDMTPIMCQLPANSSSALGQDFNDNIDNEWQGVDNHHYNVPANLPWVLLSLSELLNVAPETLAIQLWQNSCAALHTSWTYPKL